MKSIPVENEFHPPKLLDRSGKLTGLFKDSLPLQQPWELVGDPSELKIKARAEKLGLFVKAYAEIVTGYSSLVHLVLLELGKLDFTPKILSPILVKDAIFYFSLGSKTKRQPILTLFSQDQSEQIEAIITKHGLLPAFKYGSLFMSQVETVIINGITYVIDPIDDSIATLSEYT